MEGQVIEFQTDFHRVFLKPEAAKKLHDLMYLSWQDGRKKGVMRARKDLQKWEVTINNLSQLAFELQVEPGEIIE